MNAGRSRNLMDSWLWKMAWRDARHHLGRFTLLMLAITIGTAALVAIQSLSDNLRKDIDLQAKTLLGADLLLSSRQPYEPDLQALIDSVGGRQTGEIAFASMVYFSHTGGTRLINVKGLGDGYPFYGRLETEPPEAADNFRANGDALVDHGLMVQFNASVGDTIQLGAGKFRIAGRLMKSPGESAAMSLVSPPVYIPLHRLEGTGLLVRGSRVVYRTYFQLDTDADMDALAERFSVFEDRNIVRVETVESRKASLGRVFRDLYRYLNLVGFVALLLGCVGVASAVHVFVKQKWGGIAVLRCVGATSSQAFGIFLIQIVAMAFVGSLLGAALGVFIQIFLPEVVKDFVPVRLAFSVSWKAVLKGVGIATVMSVLFALLPLIAVRKISPLVTLRSSFEAPYHRRRDPLYWALILSVVVAVFCFTFVQMRKIDAAIAFTVGVGVAFMTVAWVARMLMKLIRKAVPHSVHFSLRQGLANLYRPNNQTIALMLAIGLGTFLIAGLYLTQRTLVRQIAFADRGQQPNLVFFDIQSDQIDRVAEKVRSLELPLIQSVPIVTIRLAGINSRSIEEIRRDSTSRIPRWVGEFRSTYRDTLTDTEELVTGKLQPQATDGDIRISIESEMAENIGVKIGDTLVFDVQGVTIKATVGSTRKVNWRRVQPNFFIVFPKGVLEDAPQFHVLVTRTPSPEVSAQAQQAIVHDFPNISAVDLGLILRTVDTILDKIAFVIQFMAIFSIATGVFVLIGSLLTSRFQRIEESVLLRTIGAVRKQVVQIMSVEYVLLGALAAMSGVLLAIGASWALAQWVFESPFDPSPVALVVIVAAVIFLTLTIGLIITRDVADKPPLEILRSEG